MGYSCDAESRVAAVLDQGVRYDYDPEGNRVATVTGATVSGTTATGGTVAAEYLYDTGGALVTTVNGAGQLVRSILRDSAGQHWGDFIGAAGAGGVRTEFRLVNAVGTLVANGDTDGNFIEGCLSGPFGDGEDCTPSYDFTETHFADKLRDAETDNDYFGARYFNSIMGRFMSPDPVFATVNRLYDPQQWNMYSYGRNNPLSHSDSTGLDFNLTCSDGNTATCQGGLQGQTVDGKFQATDVDMNKAGDTSAGYHDQFGNQYTGTFDQNNGVSFTNTATGDTSSNSRFIDGSDRTDVNGSGAFSGIQGQFNSNCGGSCEAKGSLFDLPGHAGATANLEQSIGASFEGNLNFFGGHGKSISFRFGDDQLTHIVNHLAGPDAGTQEVHFEGHPPGCDLTNFVLHQVDAIRDSVNHQSAQEPRLP